MIRLVGIDIDGTMTDGKVTQTPQGESVVFSRKDGHGIRLLRDAGIKVIAISSEESDLYKTRCEKLGIEYYGGITDKRAAADSVLNRNGMSKKEFAFIGDDINDRSVIEFASFSGCPADAHKDIKGIVNVVLETNGGEGAVREFAEIVIAGKSSRAAKKASAEANREVWHSIAELKNKYRGFNGIVVGTGPSGDDINEIVRDKSNTVVIGINRAIMLSSVYDFVFVDHPNTIADIAEYTSNTAKFCMPIFSRKTFNVNHRLSHRNSDKIYFYSWVYECEDILSAPDYSLNDFLLFISWGNAQSIIHFAKLLGVESLIFVGFDGAPQEKDGVIQPYAKKIMDRYGVPSDYAKKQNDYTKTLGKLEYIAQKAGIKIQFYRQDQ